NQEHHQERNDGGSSVDDQLPGVGKMKSRPCQCPNDNDQNCASKSPRAPKNRRATASEDAKCVVHHAKQVPLFFVLFQLFCLSAAHKCSFTFAPTRESARGRCRSFNPVGHSQGLIFPSVCGK